MNNITQSEKILGVRLVDLSLFSDERGYFLETFRKEWFPERSWESMQANCSFSHAGVLRGLHYHRRQVDYWFVPAGRIRVGLADMRPHSPTYRASQAIEIGQDKPIGIFIPIGVAHGFYALTDAILTYVVDNYYDGDDEFGVAWNDPTLSVAWQADHPIVSERDRLNPLLADIPAEHLLQD